MTTDPQPARRDAWAHRYDPVDHQAAVRDLLHRERLLDRVHDEIAAPPSPQEQYDHRKIAGSPTPWNDRYAMLLLDVEAGARALETRLRYNLGLPWLPVERDGYRWARPPGRAHAETALNQTVILAETLHGKEPDHDLAREALSRCLRWARRARAVLDEARPDELPWTRCPGDLRCGMCGGPLWLKPGWEDAAQLEREPVWCRTCVDDTGAAVSYPSAVWARLVAESDTPKAG